MFISVNHKINIIGKFRVVAQKSLPELPVSGVQKIINVFPSTDNSQETYFEINAANAMGLAK